MNENVRVRDRVRGIEEVILRICRELGLLDNAGPKGTLWTLEQDPKWRGNG